MDKENIFEMLATIEKHIQPLTTINNTNNIISNSEIKQSIDIISNCMLAITGIIKELTK